jgi:hypothetical protein
MVARIAAQVDTATLLLQQMPTHAMNVMLAHGVTALVPRIEIHALRVMLENGAV